MPGQKEAQPAGADSDQQLSPFLAQMDTLIRQAQPHPSRALFQSKGGREREGCPQPACAYWLAPWGRVQSSRHPHICFFSIASSGLHHPEHPVCAPRAEQG